MPKLAMHLPHHDDDNVEGESSAEKILRLDARPVDVTIP